MPPFILCDEQVPYAIKDGLLRNGIDAVSVQEIGLRSTDDEIILPAALEHGRVVYTRDHDYPCLYAEGVPHAGILYHAPPKYRIGEAIRAVSIACEVLTMEEMRGLWYTSDDCLTIAAKV